MNYIDQQYTRRISTGALKRGNVPLTRFQESSTVNNTCYPKPRLPQNIYNALYLNPDVTATLEPLPPIELPDVSSRP